MRKISIIIPIEINNYPKKTLEKLKQIDYPYSDFEIILVKGNHPSVQRNEASKQASGEILYFLDSDSLVTKDLFKQVINFYDNSEVAVVGGPNLCPFDASFLEIVFDSIQTSFFGSFLVRARYAQSGKIRETSEKELILCNMSIRKSIFDEFHGFNTNLYPNEENELLNRIKDKGYKLIYNPDAVVFRNRRTSIYEFIKQNFRYGKGRAKQMIINFFISDIIHLLPAVFSIYILFSIFFFKKLWFALFLYLILNIIFSIINAVKYHKFALVFLSPIGFFIRHFFYGIGIIIGLLPLKSKPHTIYTEVKIVKSFNEKDF